MSCGIIDIYTDGAYSFLKDRGGYAVYIPKYDISITNFSTNSTNNRMELLGVITAFEFISKLNKDIQFILFTDSSYVLGGLLYNWKIETNHDLWLRLKFLYDSIKDKVKLKHIKGHSGEIGNEIADNFAVINSKLC